MEKKKRINYIFNFRLKSKEGLQDIKDRTKALKSSKKLTAKQIYEDGLLINEGKSTEASILNKKAKEIAIRNNLITELIGINAHIEAYNRMLKNKYPSRYEDLEPEENVVEIIIIDKKTGKEIYKK